MDKPLTPIAPNKLGLSAKDIIYLIVFRELQTHSKYMRELYDSVVEEPVNLKSKSYIYQAIREMEAQGWINCIEINGKTRTMATTEAGEKKREEFAATYLKTLIRLKDAADYFAYEITGTGNKNKPVWDEGVLKHFNRLINVRHLARYLFLSILNQPEYSAETAISIYELMNYRYGWQCGEGYIYELAHEMEDASNGWLEGRWNSNRRHNYVYRLTEHGSNMISKEGQAALSYIQNLQLYTHNLLRLFQHNGK
ncbi:helix-turn-helix transcriptional regulator [Paenibacillus glucanolyticus]|jgi:DNA-binding PadR family transcriptional regulator|uniref:Uncharacterized protein n=1 Tax=Paenibacillus glucanolyticus TaxID=59843 RepID=A0A163GR89_9BACL|nr:helix-turn-helix transcriptional regulator [Paenibacillus glucanolyticus]KZS45106.1 hypothetical protein AWU65_03750 [Paenibacillus glucanolyticus]OMF65473.1 hypothetical protein BK142_30745 [Paenibacillus glucanolyticus]